MAKGIEGTAAAGAVEKLRAIVAAHPAIRLAILFGSMASGAETPESDVDIAVAASQPLSAPSRLALMDDIALAFDRPVDLIDLATVGEPLLGQIISRGKIILDTESAFAGLLYQHMIDSADFLPYRQRILAERRRMWIAC